MIDFKELTNKSNKELKDLLIEKRQEQFNLRMQLSSGQLAKNHLVRQVRKEIAQIKTAMTHIKSSQQVK